MTALKHIVEYVALVAISVPLRLLPYRAALALGWVHAWFAHHVGRYRVAEARRRIREVFGDAMPERQVRRIAWISWRNTVFDGVEMVRLSRAVRPWLRRINAEFSDSMAILRRQCARGGGAVLALPHMGSWELAGVSAHLHGIPIFTIAAAQKNPLVDHFINDLRRRPGIDRVARGSGAMREVLTKLKNGKVLAILPDVRVRSEGVPTPFLGGTANLGRGMALFARQAGVPVIPCLVVRRGWSRHTLTVGEPIAPDKSLDKEADIRRITSLVMRIMDAAIREQPEQWFWFNKRWVLDPPEPGAEKNGGEGPERGTLPA